MEVGRGDDGGYKAGVKEEGQEREREEREHWAVGLRRRVELWRCSRSERRATRSGGGGSWAAGMRRGAAGADRV